MANSLGFYNPEFFATEALISLETSLAMGGRLFRGIDSDYAASRTKGDTINIRRPSSFSAQAAPGTASDIEADSVSLTLDNWRTVKFKLNDKELAYSGERVIQEHVRPAVYALARDINANATALALEIPHAVTVPAAGSMTVSHITDARATLQKLGGFMGDDMTHAVVHPDHEADLMDLQAFSQFQGSGQMGVDAQRTGELGQRFGFRFIGDPQVTTMAASGAQSTGGLTLNGAATKGATTLALTGAGGSESGDTKKGTIIRIGDDPLNTYAITADVTNASSMTVAISPALRQAEADGATVTVVKDVATDFESLAFHENFAAIAFGALPDELPRNMGAQVATVTDDKTGYSLRSRMYYVGDSSEVHVAIDVLYGLKVLNADLAVRMHRNA
tara:strand:- start:2572 stop:3741 length:1170 start_codon:yes stop_codon:yes gene_type:complete